ncbi:helix-turn-helix transcriptional regulator [Candidatus Bathyarchaeota archaeon A05DMB-2]|nr:helix-turn-helix transcriptional regulator [Candidatus Bathyarchaeota archaeon A05DMB-2]
MKDENPLRVLRGTTLEVYLFLIKAGKPVGVREIQRALKLSSASVATYHLVKLEEAGLLRQEEGGYTVTKVILKDTIRISHFLIPRYFFYSVFTALILIIELVFLRPSVIDRGYFIYTIATAILFLIFCFETVKKWLEGGL